MGEHKVEQHVDEKKAQAFMKAPPEGLRALSFMLENNGFSSMERELQELIALARQSAATQGAKVLLSGILPTLEKSDLTLDNLTPLARSILLSAI